MSIADLPEGLTFLERGWLNANHLIVESSDGPVLIDTGHALDAARTVELLRSKGFEPESLSLIVNTHIHPDHWGGNRLLSKLSGAPIACGVKTAEAFARNDLVAMWADYFGNDGYHDPADAPLPADLVWRAGESVELGAYRFEILEAPGHAPDSIALWQPEAKVLVSADALHDGDCGILHTAVHGQGVVSDALETVHRFRDLEPKVAIPGHGPLIHDVPRALDRLENRLLGFQRHPAKLARHLCSRVLMSCILAVQPISMERLCALAEDARWFADYGPELGVSDGTVLTRMLLEEFETRGLLHQENGLYLSRVAR